MTPDPTTLAWTDLETTSLEPTNGHVLEVACIPTDLDGNEVAAEPFHRVIYYPPEDVAAMRAAAPLPVQRMHDRTGLWDRLPDGVPLWAVEEQLLAYITAAAPEPRMAAVAGSSIGALDVPFIRAQMPSVYDHVHYRTVDVSGLRIALSTHGATPPPDQGEPPHEALADARRSLDEYRYLMAQVGPVEALVAMTNMFHRACNAQVNMQESAQALMDERNAMFHLLDPAVVAWKAGAPDLDDATARAWVTQNWPELAAALDQALAAKEAEEKAAEGGDGS